ncbi:hypothetical protein ACHAW6_013248 [Cyclotella cf. meneghiniana]
MSSKPPNTNLHRARERSRSIPPHHPHDDAAATRLDRLSNEWSALLRFLDSDADVERPDATTEDIYHRFLNPSETRRRSSPSRFRAFLDGARRTLDSRRYDDDNDEKDCQYLVWICDAMFREEEGAELRTLLDRWQSRIVALLTETDERDWILWRLLLRNANVTTGTLRDAAREFVSSGSDARRYFRWPSLLRTVVATADADGANRSRKRRKTNDGSALEFLLGKMPSEETEPWLPLWGYVVSYAYLSWHRRDGSGADVGEIMKRFQNEFVPSLPSSLGISDCDAPKINAVCSGMAACLIDALGEAVVHAAVSLREDGGDCEREGTTEGGSILGAEVAQIVDLLMAPGLVSALAENIDCPLAAVVSETADTLLDYSDVHHRLAHETTPVADSHDVLATLMAEDALKVLHWMDRANPRLKCELSDQRFTSRTYDHERDDPRKHPIVAFLRALLLTGNLAEASKICRALQDCAGIHIETERYCWYLLFDKMQETQVLLEHDWAVPRRTVVPVVDRRGNVVARDFGDVTLANIMIGPLGRTAALEYLHQIVLMAKDELFPGYEALAAAGSVRSRRDADRDKQYLLAVKDAVRRTALKFLLPRPHSPAEALAIAMRVSEANASPFLPHRDGPATGRDAAELCRRILEEPPLLKAWEDEEAREAARAQSPREAVVRRETAEEDGVMDMSVEIIPPTPAETPHKSRPAEDAAEVYEEIVIGESEEEEPAREGAPEGDDEEGCEEGGIDMDAEEAEEECADEVCVDAEEEEVVASVDGDEGHYNDSMTKSLESSSHEEEAEEEEEQGYYDSNEEYPEENQEHSPPHYQHVMGNYSESDDYDQEDEEEGNRRTAFEGEYDDEEGRGSSRSDGSVEVVDILSSDADDEEGDDDEIPVADVVENESSTDGGGDETEILNAAVDDYIDAVPEQRQVEENTEEILDEAKILHDHVHEFFPVTSPRKSHEKKNAFHATMAGKEAVLAEDDLVSTATEEKSAEYFETGNTEADEIDAMDVEHPPVDDIDHAAVADAYHPPFADEEHSPAENVIAIATKALNNEANATDAIATMADEANQLEVKPAEDEAEKSDVPYSSDGGNLGGELSEDMNADDEHESLDTEDDKRSLAEQGETFDEEEVGGASPVQSHDNIGQEDIDESFEMDQPSVLVAAAMSSQRQGSSYQEVMTKSYRRASLQSFDNTDAALAATDANLSEYDEISRDGGNSLVDNNLSVLAQRNGQDLGVSSVPNEPIDVVDSDDEIQEVGQLTDDGYQPDAEVTEEEMVDNKKTRAMDDGYVPDAEATEEENTQPIERIGPKAIKKRDVRFEAVLETRGIPPTPTLPLEVAANQSIDDGYLPDGALTEEEKRDREQRRSRNIEEGYLPDGHTSATDDDSARKKERRSSHRRVHPAEAEDIIDPGYLPSAVEGTEEERSEEESQEAVASVLVAAALGTQKDLSQVCSTANRSPPEPSILYQTKSLSTQSIDEGYLPDGFTEEEHDGTIERSRQLHNAEEGHVLDGQGTPGEATEEDQPGDMPRLLLDVCSKLSKSDPADNVAEHSIPLDSCTDLAMVDTEYLRPEEEDTVIDAKNASNVYFPDGAVHDTEGESLVMVSSAEVTQKLSKSNEDVTVYTSDTATKIRNFDHGDNIVAHNASSMYPAIENETNAIAEPITKNDLLQPISVNPLTFLDDSPKTSLHPIKNTEATHTPSADAELGRYTDKGGEISDPLNTSRSPTRKTKSETKAWNSLNFHETNRHEEQGNDESVQSETSSTRRSSRLKSTRGASSPNVPFSITTGRKGAKTRTLPAVPEHGSLVEKQVAAPEEKVAGEEPSIASRTRRREKQGASDDVDASYTTSVGDASIASRTRRRGKRGASDDAPSVENEVTSGKTTRSKRAKLPDTDGGDEETITGTTKSGGGRQKRQPRKDDASDDADIKEDIAESVPSSPAKTLKGRSKRKGQTVKVDVNDEVSKSASSPSMQTRKGRSKKKAGAIETEAKDRPYLDVAEVQDDIVSESVPSSTPRARKGRSKANDRPMEVDLENEASESEVPVEVETNNIDSLYGAEIEDEIISESIPSPPVKTRRGRSKMNERFAKVNAKEDATESVSSPVTRSRKGRSKPKAEPKEAQVNEDASVSVAPPTTRGGRQKKKNDDRETESVLSPTRSSRRTRKTTPSEGSVSIVSTRSRRTTRSTKTK